MRTRLQEHLEEEAGKQPDSTAKGTAKAQKRKPEELVDDSEIKGQASPTKKARPSTKKVAKPNSKMLEGGTDVITPQAGAGHLTVPSKSGQTAKTSAKPSMKKGARASQSSKAVKSAGKTASERKGKAVTVTPAKPVVEPGPSESSDEEPATGKGNDLDALKTSLDYDRLNTAEGAEDSSSDDDGPEEMPTSTAKTEHLAEIQQRRTAQLNSSKRSRNPLIIPATEAAPVPGEGRQGIPVQSDSEPDMGNGIDEDELNKSPGAEGEADFLPESVLQALQDSQRDSKPMRRSKVNQQTKFSEDEDLHELGSDTMDTEIASGGRVVRVLDNKVHSRPSAAAVDYLRQKMYGTTHRRGNELLGRNEKRARNAPSTAHLQAKVLKRMGCKF